MFDVSKYFDNNFQRYKDNSQKYLRGVPNFLESYGGGLLLDVGCGDGTFINSLESLNSDYVSIGIDISESMLKKTYHNGHLILGSADLLPFRFNAFDIIYLNCLLHHLVKKSYKNTLLNQRKILSNIRFYLNQNGVIIVHELFYNFIYKKLNDVWFLILKILYKIGINIPGEGLVIISLNSIKTWLSLFKIYRVIGLEKYPIKKGILKYRITGVKKMGYIVAYLQV